MSAYRRNDRQDVPLTNVKPPWSYRLRKVRPYIDAAVLLGCVGMAAASVAADKPGTAGFASLVIFAVWVDSAVHR